MLIKYNTFIAEVNYIGRTSCFYGEVINCDNLLIFCAENKQDLQSAFIIAVKQYLNYLQQLPSNSANLLNNNLLENLLEVESMSG